MQYRPLGKTELEVSEVGMGTWQLAGTPWGWTEPDEDESIRALHRFVELGGNFIDTAYVYGRADESTSPEGKHTSEELIGKFLKETKEEIIIATKIPPKNRKWPAWRGVGISEVFPDDYIEEMVDASLKALDIETIDLMQFHVWQDDFVREDGWKNKIQKITQKGKVKFWGLSINDYQPSNCLETLDTGLISSIQFIFNIFHQKPVEKLLPYASKNNIGLIARVPLDEGGLTGKLTTETKFTDELHSAYFNQDNLDQLVLRIDELKKLLGKEATTMAELALRFILSHDEISTVIPGTRKVKNAEENVSVSDGRKLSQKLIQELKKHIWERNFYPDVDPSMKGTGFL